MLTILKPSELKSDCGGVLDKAIKAPQYVERNGTLLVITVADVMAGVPFRPEGFFADAYGDPARTDRERAAFAATRFKPER